MRDDYFRDGYAIIESGIAHETLDRAIEELAPKYDTQLAAGQYYPRNRLQDAWKYCPAVKSIATAPAILTCLEQFYGRKPLPFQTLNFRTGTQQPAHSDTIHFNSQPAGWMCGVWVALQDVHTAAGPLLYYPGTHTWPEVTLSILGLAPGEKSYAAYEQFIASTVAGRTPRIGLLSKGQAIIWHANLLHGGSHIVDTSRHRHSQATHYFFPGCRYYTPLLSDSHLLKLRTPQWIA